MWTENIDLSLTFLMMLIICKPNCGLINNKMQNSFCFACWRTINLCYYYLYVAQDNMAAKHKSSNMPLIKSMTFLSLEGRSPSWYNYWMKKKTLYDYCVTENKTAIWSYTFLHTSFFNFRLIVVFFSTLCFSSVLSLIHTNRCNIYI